MNETPKPKILIIDDDEDILELTSFSLKQEGYPVTTGKNGVEALEKTKEYQPNILLLDVMLPFIDGYHVAHRIMSDPLYTKKPKIILVTSRDVVHEGRLMEFSGAAGTVQKPFSMAKLKELIEKISKETA